MKKNILLIISLCIVCIFASCSQMSDTDKNLPTDSDLADIEEYSFEDDRSSDNLESLTNNSLHGYISDRLILQDWQGKNYEDSIYYNYWSAHLSDKDYLTLYDALAIDSWVEDTTLIIEEGQNPCIELYSELKENIIESIELYDNGIGHISEAEVKEDYSTKTISDRYYHLPQGIVESVHPYIVSLKEEKQLDIANNPTYYMNIILNGNYKVPWTITYDKPKQYQGKEYNENRFVCLGTAKMAKELQPSLDMETWEPQPPADYISRYQNTVYPDVSIWNSSDYFVNIYKAKDGGTYIEMPEYLVFYSTNGNITDQITSVLKNYRGEWRIDLDEE